MRCATPLGELATLPVPASAAGPPLRALLTGSEGAFGVLTEVTLRVRPLPSATRYEGFFVRSFGEGCEVLRGLVQAGAAPDVARLSDEPETAVTLALAGRHGVRHALGDAVLRARGFAEGCLLVCGWEGPSAAAIGARRALARQRLRAIGRAGGGTVGRGGVAGVALRRATPARRSARPRRAGGDARDRGDVGRAAVLHEAVRAALAPLGGRVGCHVSHVYPTGASLYFTVLARADRPIRSGQWQRAKAAATDAILAAGGTLTHHHAVGRDHAPWLAAEDGRARRRGPARGQGPAGPRRDHEPREAAAG